MIPRAVDLNSQQRHLLGNNDWLVSSWRFMTTRLQEGLGHFADTVLIHLKHVRLLARAGYTAVLSALQAMGIYTDGRPNIPGRHTVKP